MKRTLIMGLIVLLVAGLLFARGAREEPVRSIEFWYHLDDPEARLDPLIEEFEAQHPDIRIVAQHVPWDAYHERLITAIAAGNPPDVAQAKLWWQPQLVELGALQPLDDYLAAWAGYDDIYDRIWELTRYGDGTQYYMPLQMVILYMYYRVDVFDQLGLSVPQTREEFLEVARTITEEIDGMYGFGIRGARGGHDFWGTFVLSSGAEFFDDAGNVVLDGRPAIEANQWYIDLYRVHGVSPPTTPADGFVEIIDNMLTGRTAMTIHHIGSARQMHERFGDGISAFVVPAGTDGRWTSFGDEQTAILATDPEVQDAAWQWISFLATAEYNQMWNEISGQVSINQSNQDVDYGEIQRFLEVTTASADYAGVLPAHPEIASFVESVWPAEMQRALLGEITSEQMMRNLANHFRN